MENVNVKRHIFGLITHVVIRHMAFFYCLPNFGVPIPKNENKIEFLRVNWRRLGLDRIFNINYFLRHLFLNQGF